MRQVCHVKKIWYRLLLNAESALSRNHQFQKVTPDFDLDSSSEPFKFRLNFDAEPSDESR
jgi:hypothetical protein